MSLAICRRHRREDATQSCRQYCQTAKGSIAAPRPIWIRTGRVWRTTLYQSSCLESLRGESGLMTCSPQAPSHCLYYLPAMVMVHPLHPRPGTVRGRVHLNYQHRSWEQATENEESKKIGAMTRNANFSAHAVFKTQSLKQGKICTQ